MHISLHSGVQMVAKQPPCIRNATICVRAPKRQCIHLTPMLPTARQSALTHLGFESTTLKQCTFAHLQHHCQDITITKARVCQSPREHRQHKKIDDDWRQQDIYGNKRQKRRRERRQQHPHLWVSPWSQYLGPHFGPQRPRNETQPFQNRSELHPRCIHPHEHALCRTPAPSTHPGKRPESDIMIASHTHICICIHIGNCWICRMERGERRNRVPLLSAKGESNRETHYSHLPSYPHDGFCQECRYLATLLPTQKTRWCEPQPRTVRAHPDPTVIN